MAARRVAFNFHACRSGVLLSYQAANDVSGIILDLQAYINCRSSLKLELNCSAYGPVAEQHVGMHWDTMVDLKRSLRCPGAQLEVPRKAEKSVARARR